MVNEPSVVELSRFYCRLMSASVETGSLWVSLVLSVSVFMEFVISSSNSSFALKKCVDLNRPH